MVRASDAEKKRWRMKAQKAGYRQLSPFVRLALEAYEPREGKA